MPIRIPNELPATKTLSEENIFVMNESRASSQDIRPLSILVLNLMPTKIETETQLARLLGNTPIHVELELMQMKGHKHKNVSEEHMLKFYKTFDSFRSRYFDGMVITGAPLEHLDFEEVEYWDELCEIMEWSKTHVHSTFHICWGAQAGLYYHYGIQKKTMDHKLFGIFSHRVTRKSSILFRGFDDEFMVPHSRHTYNDSKDIEDCPYLKVLARSDKAGIYACSTEGCRQIFITGHSEYDPLTLDKEYRRDKDKGLDIQIPENYYPNDDDTQYPKVTWRSGANLLYSNWLNFIVYQDTPFDINAIEPFEKIPVKK